MSEYDLTGGTVGFAGVGSMCGIVSGAYSTGITQATGLNPIQTASTTAHEMGHNFGMQHDNVIDGLPQLNSAFVGTWCNPNPTAYAQNM